MIKKISTVAAILIALIIGLNVAHAIPPDQVPNPKSNNSFVSDGGAVLGPDYASLIDGISRQLEVATSAQLAVITVDNLDDLVIDDYAVALFKRLGIGVKGKDNGILILFARDDRKVKIEVGYGLEGMINDAKAGRILDQIAIPRFKADEFGRGLYDTAKAVAALAATEAGVPLTIADPTSWPTQVVPPKPIEKEEIDPSTLMAGPQAAVYYLIGAAAFALLAALILYLNVSMRSAKAARKKALENIMLVHFLTWVLGGLVTFAITRYSTQIYLPIAAYVISSIAISFLIYALSKSLKAGVEAYVRSCKACKVPMVLVGEKEDDALLTEAERNEEKAGGMDYEFWKCAGCGKTERFEIKMEKAEKCPKCKRRTLQKITTTLEAATTGHGGREKIEHICRNSGCGYRNEKITTTAAISSSSSGGSSSGGSSFGGGSSGGGGASRGF